MSNYETGRAATVPADGGISRALAHAHVTSENLQVARDAITEEIRRNPHSAISHLGKAKTLSALGMPLEAAKHLADSLDVAPDYHLARYELALNYHKRGMSAEALAELEIVATCQSGFPGLSMQVEAIKAMGDVPRYVPASDTYQPIFLLAPVARCGSTFLQRLVTSSGKIVIFGENLDLTMRFPECVEEASYKIGSQRAAAPGSGEDYFVLALRNFYRIVEFYQSVANKAKRVWGIKDPYSGQMGTLRSLLPSAKFIFLLD